MLRNCLKKGFRPVAVLAVAVLMCSLGGCSDSESGWLEGRAFTEDGLEPVKDFAADALKSQDTEKTTGTGSTSQLLNRYKDSFAKKHVVVIKSQTGMPIEAFNGDSIKWDIDDNLPKTTRLMVDGKTMYIHRANFQIMDKDSLQ